MIAKTACMTMALLLCAVPVQTSAGATDDHAHSLPRSPDLHTTESGGPSVGHGPEHETEDVVRLTRAQRKAAGIVTEVLVPQVLGSTLRGPGEMVLNA